MKLSLALVPLLLVGLSGCLSNGTDDSSELEGLALTFRDPVELICPDHPTYGAYPSGDMGECAGFGEPTLEVAGDGAIWYSSVCCVGQSPPIWVSRDGGETFEALPFADGTGATRDAGGVEGDFAIDDAGNVYFFDITAATSYFTKYQADGTHVHTKADVFQPLVDRPWVRAGVEDEVWIFYNTGTNTILHHSTDGGLTWDFPMGTTFDCNLMTFGQGAERDDLVVSGCGSDPAAWVSNDGGQTFSERIPLPLPEDEVATESYMQPSMDAAGYAYIPVTHTLGRIPPQERTPLEVLTEDAPAPQGDIHEVISLYIVSPDGDVNGPLLTTAMDGLVDKPWSIAGKDGVYAMAYYAADGVDREHEAEDAIWDLRITYTLDGHAAEPTWFTVTADDNVLQGTFGRQLGDFLQLRQTEDGGLAVAYASRDAPDAPLRNWFIRTDVGPDFGPEVFRNGPAPA